MPIADHIEQALKDAMRAKDKALVSCLRQVKAKAQEAMNAPSFTGPKDDAFYQGVIARYSKMLRKSLEELKRGGERGAELAASYEAELETLAAYLPKPLGDSELAAAVRELLASGQYAAKDLGRAMGPLLAKFKGQLEPARAKQALSEGLAALGSQGQP